MPEITEAAISAYLDKRGIRFTTSGRKYLADAIRYRLDNPGNFKITAMYTKLAVTSKTTYCAIERCIRHAIGTSQDINDAGDKTDNYDAYGKMVTNKEFIERAVNDLQLAAKNDSRPE